MKPDTFLVHVTQLRRRPGSRQDVRRSVPVSDIGLSSASVPDGTEVTLDLVLESIPEGIVASGALEVAWEALCRRCLEPMEGVLAVDVREIFESRPVDGETWLLDGDQVDLEPMVRDNLLLALPLAPLCDEACRGPAPDTFPTFPTEEAGDPAVDADEPRRDPRWAALDGLDLTS